MDGGTSLVADGCSQAKVCSTTLRTLPSPEPWAMPRRAIRGCYRVSTAGGGTCRSSCARSACKRRGVRRGRPRRPRISGMASSRGKSWVASCRLPPVSVTASGHRVAVEEQPHVRPVHGAVVQVQEVGAAAEGDAPARRRPRTSVATPPATPNHIRRAPFSRAPPGCWWARTIVKSTAAVQSRSSSASAAARTAAWIISQVPSTAHLISRLRAVWNEPSSSGRSRQGEVVRYFHAQAQERGGGRPTAAHGADRPAPAARSGPTSHQ